MANDTYPTHAELLEAYQSKRATLPVNRMNHREFVMDGVRYFCGFDSRVREGWPEPDWFVYGKEAEVKA